jgi:hypothetical protein
MAPATVALTRYPPQTSAMSASTEGRNVATANIPGAFMQTKMKGTVHMVLEGTTMAKLLVKIDPKLYRNHLLIKKGKPVM